MADVDRGESPVLEDMKKLDETVNGFLEVKIKQYWGNISFAYLTDISNEHNGKQLTIGYDKDYISGNWFFTPSFNATLSDNRLVNYFYGVSKQEVHSTRPLYTADASWSISTTLMLGYAIDRNNTVFSFISGTWFDDQIRDSPITEKTTVIAAGLGYQYLF